jgi:hypothetical protein
LLQELFLTQLLPDRKLKVLESQPLGQLPPSTCCYSHYLLPSYIYLLTQLWSFHFAVAGAVPDAAAAGPQAESAGVAAAGRAAAGQGGRAAAAATAILLPSYIYLCTHLSAAF